MKEVVHKLLRLLACIGSGALAGGIIQWQLADAGYTIRQVALFSLSMGIGVFLFCYYITAELED